MFLDYLSSVHIYVRVWSPSPSRPQAQARLTARGAATAIAGVRPARARSALLKFVVYRAPTLPVTVAAATNPCQWPQLEWHLNRDSESDMKIEQRPGKRVARRRSLLLLSNLKEFD